MTIDAALEILKQYSGLETKSITSQEEKDELQQALLLTIPETDSYNLGICADTKQEALTALVNYLKAFNCEFKPQEIESDRLKEPVYLKFKVIDNSYYLDNYQGEYRGVLVSCQSENESISGTYGHFPLNLFTNE